MKSNIRYVKVILLLCIVLISSLDIVSSKVRRHHSHQKICSSDIKCAAKCTKIYDVCDTAAKALMLPLWREDAQNNCFKKKKLCNDKQI